MYLLSDLFLDQIHSGHPRWFLHRRVTRQKNSIYTGPPYRTKIYLDIIGVFISSSSMPHILTSYRVWVMR